MANKGTGNVGLTYPTKGLDNGSLRPALDELSDVILDRGWLRQIEVLPTQVEEVPEVP
tara:strand:- start:1563 stop:1736 length:174 start_codon:yes stop_codon:yes gene_type:complete